MKQVLIVEDDENLNKGINIALRGEYCCVQAFTLQQAREIWKEQRPDLILLDVNLPDGSGIDLMAEIRRFDRTPIILLTANNMEMDIVTGLESGANDYITKSHGPACQGGSAAAGRKRHGCCIQMRGVLL